MKRPKLPEGRIIKEGGKHANYCGCNACRLIEESKREFRRSLFFPIVRNKNGR